MNNNQLNESNRRIYIELLNRCNLRCSFCPYPGLKNYRDDMELNLVKKLIDDIKINIPYRIIYFHNLGEPLLYEQLNEVMEYCDKNNINYGITTNGLLLAKNSDIFSNKKINQINISYQATRESLHKDRKINMSAGSYRKLVVDSIKTLQSRGYDGIIKIKLLITNSGANFKNKRFENIKSIIELISEVDKLYYEFFGQNINSVQRKKIAELNIYKHNKIQIKKNLFIEIFPFLSWGNYEQNVWQSVFGKCDAIKEQLVVLSNGDVVPCCYDIDSNMLIGNVKSQKLSEILTGKRAKQLENEFSSIFVKQKRCKSCLGSHDLKESINKQLRILLDKNESMESENVIYL